MQEKYKEENVLKVRNEGNEVVFVIVRNGI